MRSYTVKLLLSLLLLLGANNAKAYCYATQWAEYGPVYSSLGVANGTTMESCQQLACQLFPFIPECGQPVQPTCTTRTEVQSLACQPNYSGAINQARSNSCPNEDMGPWVTVSDNCTPDPPTCNYSVQEEQRACGQNQIGAITYKREQNCPDPYSQPVDSGWFEIRRDCSPAPATCTESTLQRTLSCSEGYTGLITQQQTSSCSDPYSQPIFGQWVEIQNSCQKSVTNPMNVNSPVSPISPVNQMDVPVPTPMEVPPVAPVEMQMQMTVETPKVETQKSSGSESTSSSPTASSSTETKETPQKIEVPKGKDLVPGFGLVMSLELLNKPMEFQQQQLQNNLDYTQELSNEFRGNTDFLLQLLTDNDVGDSFRSRNDRLWGNLRRHNDLQPCYSCD
jgi:hypothetical protein